MKDNNKGFSGLEGLSTNIDDILEEAAKNDKKNEEESSQNSSNSSNSSNKAEKLDEENKNKSRINWWTAALGAIIFIFLSIILNSNIKVQKSNPPPQYKSTDTVTQSSASNTPNQAITRREPEIKPVVSKTEDVYKEEKPPISSNNILNIFQLRYCQAEKIRMDTSSVYVDHYSDKDIDTYNSYIADYNSRCPQSHYYEKDMAKVNKEIADRKYIIEQEGRQRFIVPAKKSSNISIVPESEPLFTLAVSTTPSDATIKILNISPKYQHGISLKKGSYHVEITKSGYHTVNKKINLEKNESLHINLTKDSSLESDNQAVKVSNTTTPLSTKQTNSYKLPANAKLNYSGNDWECERGYYRSGNECKSVILPNHSKLNYSGNDWECERGYYKSGGSCQQVLLPANSKLNYSGNAWECERGYYKSGGSCKQVLLPTNSKLNYSGNDWECERGFYKFGNECKSVILPNHSKLNYSGNDWECERGYYKSGGSCQQVLLPANSKLNYSGNAWECERGFKKLGTQCIPVGVAQ